MSYAIGPAATGDNYTSLVSQRTQKDIELVDVWVSGNPVYYQLRDSDDSEWGTEHYLPGASGETAFYSFNRRCSGIQFRSALAGNSATVICQLIPAEEVPG